MRGVIDLRKEVPGGRTLRLDGEWRYYPRRLVVPGDRVLEGPPPAFASLPGTWDGLAQAPGEPSGHGFATYVLTVLLPPDPPPLALRMTSVSTAFRLFADGVEVASAGTVATTAERGRPAYLPQVVHLPPSEDGRLELVLQVSNFHYQRGGVWEPIWVGTVQAVERAREGRVALAVFLAGAFAVIGLYHLMRWGGRRQDRSLLIFATLCFGMALRGLTVDEIFLVDLAPSLSWTGLVRLEYGSLLIIVAATALFLREMFPEEQPRPLIAAYSVASICGLAAVMALSPDRFSRGLPALQILCISGAIVGTLLVGRSLVRGREGAALFLVSLFAITATGIHDVLISIYRVSPTGGWFASSIYLQPFGLMVFILAQATLLARRSSRAFGELERTSRELQAAHAALDSHARELEERVTERTAELESANRKLAHLAEIDTLTRVGNRRFFEEELRRAWFDHLRRLTPLSLALVDVDHFKAYNDRYGHIAGDDTLRRISTEISRVLRRPGDAVARYGGEELAVLLPNTDARGALYLGERVRRRIETVAIEHEASDVAPHVTVSIGVATLVPRIDLEREELVERADRALYRAKEGGRNRVFAAPTGDGSPGTWQARETE